MTPTPPFTDDAVGAVLGVLEQAGRALSAVEVKLALQAGGSDAGAVDRAWPRIRTALRAHPNVIVEPGRRYRFTPQPVAVSVPVALDLLAGAGVPAARRAELVAQVRAALVTPRSVEVALVRALAELAIEVEELAVNQASARALIHRVRAQVRRVGLEPIEQAGEMSTLDRQRHEPIGHPIPDGTPVVVVRPGYVLRSADGDVVIARAVVQDRS